MFILNNTIYAGISNEKGANVIEQYSVSNTGYTLVRLSDGAVLGSRYEMKDNENPKMFVEYKTEDKGNYYTKHNIMIAGVINEAGFDICIQTPDVNLGKHFIRIHDGFVMGVVLPLGIDYSYDKKGRKDLPIYYIEVDDLRSN